MKYLVDFFPIILFFSTYWLTRNIFTATGMAIAATALLVIWTWLRHRKIDMMQWINLGLITVLGGATLLFHDKYFVMWKPTVLYWIMGIGLLFSDFLGKNGLKCMLSQQLTLPNQVWNRLTWAWVAFFIVMGALNLFVAYHFSEAIWVNFKLFGGMGLILVFVIVQSVALSKYLKEK